MRSRGLILLLLLSCATSALADKDFVQAEALINSGRYSEAFAVLKASADQGAATPHFDYLLGVAALKSDQPVDAIYAFERVLGTEPENLDARIGIAQAYLATGENDAALIELDMLLTQRLTKEQSALVKHHNSIALSRVSSGESKFSASIGLGAGYDSNVNGGPESSTVVVPNVGPVNLTAQGAVHESTFGAAQGSVDYTHFLQSDAAVFLGAKTELRDYYGAGDFNYQMLRLYGGAMLIAGEDQYKLSVIGQKHWVGEIYQNVTGAKAQYRRDLTQRTALLGFGQALRIVYPQQNLRDVNQFLAGVGLEHALEGRFAPLLSGSVYLARDRELTSSREDMGRTLYGVQLGAEIKPDAANTFFALFRYQKSRYGGIDPLFLDKRRDTLSYVTLGWSRKLNENWVLQPEIRYTLNQSSLAIDDLHRTEVLVMLNHPFQASR